MRRIGKNKKAGLLGLPTEQIIKLVLIVVVILALTFLGQKLYRVLTAQHAQDLAYTKNNFKNLVEEVNKLVNEPYTFSATSPKSLLPYYVGNQYVIVGFDKGDPPTVTAGDLCNDVERGKPQPCGDEACIVIYDANTWDDDPGTDPHATAQGIIDFAKFPIDAAKFPDVVNVKIYSKYISEVEHEPMNLGLRKVNVGLGVSEIVDLSPKAPDDYGSLFVYGGNEEHCAWKVYGRVAGFNQPPVWGVQTMYIEKFVGNIAGKETLQIYITQAGDDTKQRYNTLYEKFGGGAPERLLKKGDKQSYEEILTYYSKTPEADIARYRLGLIYYGENKIEEAFSKFEEVGDASLAKANATFMVLKIDKEKRNKESLDAYENFIKTYTENENLHLVNLWIGDYYYNEGDKDKAEKAYDDTIKDYGLKEGGVLAQFGRARIYQERGDLDDAKIGYSYVRDYAKSYPQFAEDYKDNIAEAERGIEEIEAELAAASEQQEGEQAEASEAS